MAITNSKLVKFIFLSSDMDSAAQYANFDIQLTMINVTLVLDQYAQKWQKIGI